MTAMTTLAPAPTGATRPGPGTRGLAVAALDAMQDLFDQVPLRDDDACVLACALHVLHELANLTPTRHPDDV